MDKFQLGDTVGVVGSTYIGRVADKRTIYNSVYYRVKLQNKESHWYKENEINPSNIIFNFDEINTSEKENKMKREPEYIEFINSMDVLTKNEIIDVITTFWYKTKLDGEAERWSNDNLTRYDVPAMGRIKINIINRLVSSIKFMADQKINKAIECPKDEMMGMNEFRRLREENSEFKEFLRFYGDHPRDVNIERQLIYLHNKFMSKDGTL